MVASALMPARSSSLFFTGRDSLLARAFSASSTTYSGLGMVKLSRTSLGFFSLAGLSTLGLAAALGAGALAAALALGAGFTAARLGVLRAGAAGLTAAALGASAAAGAVVVAGAFFEFAME